MKKRLSFFLMLLIPLLTMAFVQAQELTYSGTVRDAEGNPLSGVSVAVVGTTIEQHPVPTALYLSCSRGEQGHLPWWGRNPLQSQQPTMLKST